MVTLQSKWFLLLTFSKSRCLSFVQIDWHFNRSASTLDQNLLTCHLPNKLWIKCCFSSSIWFKEKETKKVVVTYEEVLTRVRANQETDLDLRVQPMIEIGSPTREESIAVDSRRTIISHSFPNCRGIILAWADCEVTDRRRRMQDFPLTLNR